MSLVEIEIDADAWLAALPQAADVARRAAEAALSGYPDLADSDVVVLLADDTELQDLNREHRGKDAPTNVLSFPAPEWAAPHLGDIALSFETCAAEAAAQGKSLEAHLAHLTVHGILHLLGHDHQADDEAETMEALERQILKGLGYADPYAGEAA